MIAWVTDVNSGYTIVICHNAFFYEIIGVVLSTIAIN